MLFPRFLSPDDRPALRVDAERLSYRQLAQACARHLDVMREAKIGRGDRVLVWTPSSIVTPVVLAAHACGGIVSVPINAKLGARELAHVIADARPLAIVGDDIELASHTPSLPFIRAQVDTNGPSVLPELDVDSSAVLVLYTSGTTGAPKGAVLTRANVASNLDALADAWQWTLFDTVVHALPLFHVHGLVLGLFGSLRVGGSLSWLGRFDPASVAGALHDGVLFAVPTMYHRLAEAAEIDPSIRAALSHARLLVSGSAGLPVREHRRIEALCGRGVLERYGLTETLINCAVRAEQGPQPGFVGSPLSGIELALVDDARRPMEARDDATIGEIAVRGPNVFAGYLNRPDATGEVLDAQNFFYTGDLATRSAGGAIRIVGRRATDLIKSGGFKIGAGEIEAALLEHAAVAEAAVIGMPDDDLGERIVAFVVRRTEVAEADLVEHVALELAPHKRPREVRFVPALPRNAMGKVRKAELKKA